MNIEFSDDIQNYINQQVAAGVFATPEALLAEAVARMREVPLVHWSKDALRAAVALGADQIDRGELVGQTIDEIFAEWERDHSNGH